MTAVQEKQFGAAAAAAKSLKKLSNDELLGLYGLYKQATVGDVNVSQPGSFDFTARAKWDAWASRKGMGFDQAKTEYVSLVTRLQKKESSKTAAGAATAPSISAATISTSTSGDKISASSTKIAPREDTRPPAYFEMVRTSEALGAAQHTKDTSSAEIFPRDLKISALDVLQGRWPPQGAGLFFRGVGLDSDRLKTAVQYVLDRSPAIGGRLVSDVGRGKEGGAGGGGGAWPVYGVRVDPRSLHFGVGFFHIPDVEGDSFFVRNTNTAVGREKVAEDDDHVGISLLPDDNDSEGLFDLYRPRSFLGVTRARLTKLMKQKNYGPFYSVSQSSLSATDQKDTPLLCVGHLQLKANPKQSALLVFGNHCLFDGGGGALTAKAIMAAYTFGTDPNPSVQQMVTQQCLLDAENLDEFDTFHEVRIRHSRAPTCNCLSLCLQGYWNALSYFCFWICVPFVLLCQLLCCCSHFGILTLTNKEMERLKKWSAPSGLTSEEAKGRMSSNDAMMAFFSPMQLWWSLLINCRGSEVVTERALDKKVWVI